MEKIIIDGNEACSRVAYNFTEVAGIYPITPSSTMAEYIDKWSNDGKKNYFNNSVKVVEMQSEKGAIGFVHGALQEGGLATTFTSSQGLLLMIPNMYKIAGEMLPCVINVAARTVATHALSILGDHSDIYAARATGFAMLASSSVQQVMDLTNVSYLSTIDASIPFVNFFDGFRTSHEMNTIEEIDYDKVKNIINYNKLDKFRNRALDVDNPKTVGTNQSDQIYFQEVESRNKYYDNLPDVVNSYMMKINLITGRCYHPFNYYGANDATKVIVAMGSVCETIKETVDYLNNNGLKVGLIEVHLFRPFSLKYFKNTLPITVKNIAVLDRAKEPGSIGEPLYLDVVDAVNKLNKDIKIIGGRYGLSSKNTTPNDIEAVYNFLDDENNFSNFTIGIIDDVTNLSLNKTNTKFDNNHQEMVIYGFGSDGMVTASKDIIKTIFLKNNLYVQGYFEYDSKKSNGVTKSHLRYSKDIIKSTYYVSNPKLVVCTKDTYLEKYDVLENICENGIFILNTTKKIDNIHELITKEMLETLKNKKIFFYIVDASSISIKNSIPNKISMIMESIILEKLGLLDLSLLKENIKKNFLKKGEDVVKNNINAIEEGLNNIIKVDINKLQSTLESIKIDESVFSYLDHFKGDLLKVSAFDKYTSGAFEGGLSKLERRGSSEIIPSYDKNKCIMCNLCSFVCPHAVVRPFLLDNDEVKNAPKEVKGDLKNANVKDKNLSFTIGTSPLNCTGCSLCSNICPTKALTMKKKEKDLKKDLKKEEYLFNKVSEKDAFLKNTVKGSQFVNPKFEFHGACAGCGETSYIKLLTQLFGTKLVMANATGCSSIYGASLPSTPYTVPWANSLFEDNAEFGLGIKSTDNLMKDKIKQIMREKISYVNEKNQILFNIYLNDNNEENNIKVYNELDYENIPELLPLKKYIKNKTVWIVGGDGWAYDIGFDGIDHALASGENINILVLDTEVYSNTGGQASKSTRLGAVAKFASNGKKTAKKDLAKYALIYDNVYVATVSLGANYNQTLKAFIEANNYDGPSIIIAYAPCIAHGIKTGMKDTIKKEKEVVEIGYFPLFRYNPETNKFVTDNVSNFDNYEKIFEEENRYISSKDNKLKENNKINAMKRYEYYKTLENNDK